VRYRRELLADRTRLTKRLHADLHRLRPGYQTRLRKLTSLNALDRARRLLARDPGVRARLARQRITRLRRLHGQITRTTDELTTLAGRLGTRLTDITGIAQLAAGELLAEVGDVTRYATKAQFAMANGTAPLPASSGRTTRHRLNRGGNRQLNRSLHLITLTQVSRDPEGRAYYQRKTSRRAQQAGRAPLPERRISDRVYQTLRAHPPQLELT
jgi:transposase